MKVTIMLILALDLIYRLTAGLVQDFFSFSIMIFLMLTILGIFFNKKWGGWLAWIYASFLILGSIGFIILTFALNTELSILFVLRLVEGIMLSYLLLKSKKSTR
jgi:hypothetical protein